MAMHQPPFPPWLPLVMLPVMWVVVSIAISVTGGWSALATRYRTDAPAPPNVRYMQWATFGWAAYKGVLTIGYTDEGLYLGMLFLFRIYHPPLLIPWSAITSRKRGRYWLMQVDTLEIAGVTVRLRTSVTDSFVQHLPAAQ
jgi:hypothetical protein